MQKLTNYMNFCFLILLLCFQSSCHKNNLAEENVSDQFSDATIQPRSLYGNWELSVMRTDVGIDLNGDGTANTNLLLETDCYSNMRIQFFEDGTFFTENAQMDFAAGAGDNTFECLDGRQDKGNWEIKRDLLILNIKIDGEIYTDAKVIKLTGNRFTFEVTKAESNMYVNDPGNTMVSGIQILEVEYTRSN